MNARRARCARSRRGRSCDDRCALRVALSAAQLVCFPPQRPVRSPSRVMPTGPIPAAAKPGWPGGGVRRRAGRRVWPHDHGDFAGRSSLVTPSRAAEITAQRLLRSAESASCTRFSSREPEKADTASSCRRQNCTTRRRLRRGGRWSKWNACADSADQEAGRGHRWHRLVSSSSRRRGRPAKARG
jgi:hypothetical protein